MLIVFHDQGSPIVVHAEQSLLLSCESASLIGQNKVYVAEPLEHRALEHGELSPMSKELRRVLYLAVFLEVLVVADVLERVVVL